MWVDTVCICFAKGLPADRWTSWLRVEERLQSSLIPCKIVSLNLRACVAMIVRVWAGAMPRQSPSRLTRLGIVRMVFPALVPEWFSALASPIKAQMTALYSRPNPGYAEALRAYETTPVSQRPCLAPGALGTRPVIALSHGKRSRGLSAEFEAGWASSQDRLAHLSQAGVVVVANGADHQIAQEEPELAARTVLGVLEQVSLKN